MIKIIYLLSALTLLGAPQVHAAVPFRLLDNRLITQIRINGRGPFYVMFDTGATNIIANEVADKLGLQRHDQFPISGGGESPVMAAYCDVDSLEFDSQTIQNSQVLCMDLQEMQKAIGFPHLDGLIGYEFLKQHPAEINFDQMQISLFNDHPGRPATGGSPLVIPLSFQGTTPVIEAVLDGVTGEFWLDTGDRFSATLSTPFAQAHSLQEKYNTTAPMMTGYGIGGPLKTTVAVAHNLQIGGSNFIDLLIRIPAMKSQALSDPNAAGTIGMGWLRQFNIVLDYSDSKLILTRNSVFQQDRSFDRSGLWLSQSTEGFLIADVVEGGPAWDAGLRPGQIVVGIDNRSSSQIDLLTLREALKDPRLSQVTFLIKDNLRSYIINLKNLLPNE